MEAVVLQQLQECFHGESSKSYIRVRVCRSTSGRSKEESDNESKTKKSVKCV